MLLNVFSIFDSKANAYLQPFFSVNRAVAIRNFTAAACDEASNFSKYAEDYTLFEIGVWDDQVGSLSMMEAKVPLGTALEFRSARNADG